jgi:organic hydroperoxide reductase OsmC/OhrA
MTGDVSIHLASIAWQRGKWAEFAGKYSRGHLWRFAGGAKLKVSDSPAFLPEGYRDGARLDPENMFVATIASSHMLCWLQLAFDMEIDVMNYVDAAHGLLSELSEGVYWVSEVILHPKVTYGTRRTATPAAEARLHELAQEQSFIARSVKTKVTVCRGADEVIQLEFGGVSRA